MTSEYTLYVNAKVEPVYPILNESTSGTFGGSYAVRSFGSCCSCMCLVGLGRSQGFQLASHCSPSPPLDEQRRVVARIEELATRVEEARGLRRETIEELSAFLSSEAGRIVANVAARFEVRSLGSYNPHVTSGPRYWNSRYSNTGFRFYRAQDIGSKGQDSE